MRKKSFLIFVSVLTAFFFVMTSCGGDDGPNDPNNPDNPETPDSPVSPDNPVLWQLRKFMRLRSKTRMSQALMSRTMVRKR